MGRRWLAQVVLFDVADLGRGAVGQATTDEAGQFALPLTASAALVLPQGFALGQNYPNPFNPSTIIPYQLAATSLVRLEVFNVLGQRMATLVDGEQAAGSYRVRWDGTDAVGRAAASGVYFYRLTVAGLQQTGKMVLTDGQAGVPLGGPSVEVEPLAAGSTGSYGLVVSGAGLVAYVDSDFGVAAGPVDLVVEPQPQGQGKVVVPMLEGMLGDVNNSGHVDLDDGLLVAMHRVDPSLALPNHGYIGLGDVDCNGRVERADAELLATYVVYPSASAVSSLRIGQRGGYSLDPVTERVWGSILGTAQQDATVARLLDEVPVLISGVLEIDGRDHLYLGIDRDYYQQYGGEHIYNALKERFPITPLFVEASEGVQRPERRAWSEAVPPSAKRATDEPDEEPEEEMDEEPEEEPEDDGGGLLSFFDLFDDDPEGPDLTVSRTTASPASVQPGDPVTLSARITNLGTADAQSANVHVYRHTATTTDPRRIGTREPNATVTGTLLVPNASVSVAVETTAPAVAASTTYYYYVCVDLVEGEQQGHNNCSRTPANVTVQSGSAPADEGTPATPEDETSAPPAPPETPAPTETPTLTIPLFSVSPTNPETGTPVRVRLTVKNDGTETASSETIRLYRHRSRTNTPRTGGTRLSDTASTGSLAPGASVTRTISASTPSVTTATTYYYYACVGEENGCADPAELRIYPTASINPPYETCYTAAVHDSAPMGGDAFLVQFIKHYDGLVVLCGTMTLGGLETADGTRGFVVAAHSVSETDASDLSTDTIETLIGHTEYPTSQKLRRLLGKVLKMPSTRTEGGKRVLSVDAAFVKYPHPLAPGCSLTWQDDGEAFCLDDTDQDNYVDRLSPLTIRGENGDTYQVTGSRRPTKGLKVTYSGARTGPSDRIGTVDGKLLIRKRLRGLHHYVYAVSPNLGVVSGDSGSPIYTIPDADGTTRIVGLQTGVIKSSTNNRNLFAPWEEIEDEFNLKPISP